MLNRRELIEAAIGAAGLHLLPPISCDCDVIKPPDEVAIVIPYPGDEPKGNSVRVNYVAFHKPDDSDRWFCDMQFQVNDAPWVNVFFRSKERVIETAYVTVRWTDDCGLEFEPSPLCDHLIIAGRVQLF